MHICLSYLSVWNKGLSIGNKRLHVIHEFFQIQVVFQPESSDSTEVNKCHQLGNAILHLNKAASRTSIPGRKHSSKTGGIPSRSQYNPVWQYKSIKLDSMKLIFSYQLIHVMDTALSNTLMFISDKMSTIILFNQIFGIYQLLKKQNAVVTTWLYKDPCGYRELCMDNCYSAPELFICWKSSMKSFHVEQFVSRSIIYESF